jgi:hypothetical protein
VPALPPALAMKLPGPDDEPQLLRVTDGGSHVPSRSDGGFSFGQ